MNALEKISKLCDSLKVENEPDVLNFKRYKTPPKTWITYNYSYQNSNLFGDDGPEDDIASVQVHLFTPVNKSSSLLQKQIKAGLIEAGFTCPQVTISREDNIRHIIFECDIDESLEED